MRILYQGFMRKPEATLWMPGVKKELEGFLQLGRTKGVKYGKQPSMISDYSSTVRYFQSSPGSPSKSKESLGHSPHCLELQ